MLNVLVMVKSKSTPKVLASSPEVLAEKLFQYLTSAHQVSRLNRKFNRGEWLKHVAEAIPVIFVR